MNIQEYLEERSKIYTILFNYLECEDELTEYNYQIFKDFLIEQKILENREEMKSFLYLISKITKNYSTKQDFFLKIEAIFLDFQENIKQTFSNFEIFYFFKKQKRILLFLFCKEIIILDEHIADYMLKRYDLLYKLFFYQELKNFISIKEKKLIEDKLKYVDQDIFDDFEIKRQIGENHSYICSLIRNDSIEEFVAFINKQNLSHSSSLCRSIYETNSFLIKNQNTSLIEYAAFFGSIQIFQYLRLNGVKLESSLWLYTIHGRNNEIIHILEDNHVIPDDKSYKKCLKESIKCHNNELSNYLLLNYIDNDPEKFGENVVSYSFHYYNYEYFSIDLINDKFIFYYACQHDYITLVKLLLDFQEIDLNNKIISNILLT